MLDATCRCTAVKVTVPYSPDTLTDCNCSICRRYGVLWAYYKADDVKVDAVPDSTDEYVWGRRVLRFVRCSTCGCLMYWQRIVPVMGSKMGVNARNLPPEIVSGTKIELLDGASG